jgi:hypothetical protein
LVKTQLLAQKWVVWRKSVFITKKGCFGQKRSILAEKVVL